MVGLGGVDGVIMVWEPDGRCHIGDSCLAEVGLVSLGLYIVHHSRAFV